MAAQVGAGFEERAAEALAAWRDKRFELPDYYLVMAAAQPGGTGPDLYLGPLRAARPRRVAVAGIADSPGQIARLSPSWHGVDPADPHRAAPAVQEVLGQLTAPAEH